MTKVTSCARAGQVRQSDAGAVVGHVVLERGQDEVGRGKDDVMGHLQLSEDKADEALMILLG